VSGADQVRVTQADREAAADAVKAYRGQKNNDWQARIRRSECDDGEMVQAFARHRHTAQSDALAVMVKAREALAGLLTVAKHGSPNADDRVKQWVSAVFAARAALADLDAAINQPSGA